VVDVGSLVVVAILPDGPGAEFNFGGALDGFRFMGAAASTRTSLIATVFIKGVFAAVRLLAADEANGGLADDALAGIGFGATFLSEAGFACSGLADSALGGAVFVDAGFVIPHLLAAAFNGLATVAGFLEDDIDCLVGLLDTDVGGVAFVVGVTFDASDIAETGVLSGCLAAM
jgi:hypothetical protein